jgi:hypothetical protein
MRWFRMWLRTGRDHVAAHLLHEQRKQATAPIFTRGQAPSRQSPRNVAIVRGICSLQDCVIQDYQGSRQLPNTEHVGHGRIA